MILTVEMPDEMAMYAEDIQEFVGLMVHKLHKNMHKGRWEELSLASAYMALMEESDELHRAIREQNTDEAYLEAADVANFAMIIASIMRERGNDIR